MSEGFGAAANAGTQTSVGGAAGTNSAAGAASGSPGVGGMGVSAVGTAGGMGGLGAAGSSLGTGATAGTAMAADSGSAQPGMTGGATTTDPSSNAPAAAAAPLSECNGLPLPERARSQQQQFVVGPETAGLEPYWPTDGWRTEAPDKLGFDPAKLETALDFGIRNAQTQALFVVRHGYVAAERYFGATNASTRTQSYSMAKSFTSALVGIAIGEGKLTSTSDRICAAYDEWDCNNASDQHSEITIEHAMNLTTGLQWSEGWRSDDGGTNDAYTLDILSRALSRPVVTQPGTAPRYSTGDPALLTGVLQQATGMTAYAYAKEKVFDVIGIPGVRWDSDIRGFTTTHMGIHATAAEYAKFGLLYLNSGQWDGQQVVPQDWVLKTTYPADACDDWYKWLWHINMPNRLGVQGPSCDELFCAPTEYVDLPRDGFFAEGINGQFIFIVPSADLVVVRLAQDGPGSEFWDDYARGFMLAVFDAIIDQ